MNVVFHPEFANDIRRFENEYLQISERLASRFRAEVDDAIDTILASPERAGHFLQAGSQVIRDFRRSNLKSFPFFVLYGLTDDTLIFGSVTPSRSDPMRWLTRFGGPH